MPPGWTRHGGIFEVEQDREKYLALEAEVQKGDFWQKPGSAEKIKVYNGLKEHLARWDALKKELGDLEELFHLVKTDDQAEDLVHVNGELDRISLLYASMKKEMFFRGEADKKNVYLTIHSGAGGTEACDWVTMLLRMYLMWSENKGFKTGIIDQQPGEEAGLRSVTVNVRGENAFGLLKSETGVHRLVRISPFDANKRRHTSFASVDVTPEIEDDIEVEILEKDLKVDTFRASGAGGQYVNKTDSAIRITHIPTGVVVACQSERSQHKNRSTAMKMLRSKLYEMQRLEREKANEEKEKLKKKIEWGSQIRSYVFQPYMLVKDHRTGTEIGNVPAVMDGRIDPFIDNYLEMFG